MKESPLVTDIAFPGGSVVSVSGSWVPGGGSPRLRGRQGLRGGHLSWVGPASATDARQRPITGPRRVAFFGASPIGMMELGYGQLVG
jgi:hypothetical protein